MKVCIFGAGVIGGILGCAIARAGHEVSLIARGPQLTAVQASGLTMVTPDDHYTLAFRASSVARDLGPQDLVIVATKTTALPAVARDIGPLLSPDTLVGFAQNGVFWFYGEGLRLGGIGALDLSRLDPNGELQEQIGPERAFGIVCFSGGEIETPGVIHATRTGGQFHAGATVPKTDERCAALVKALDTKDVNIDHTNDIRTWMWRKHASVVSNQATCSLTGATIGQNHAHPGVHDIVLRLMGEACSIAAVHGFDLGFDIEEKRRSPMTSPHKPSMLQDIERGRPVEIASQYLVLQDLARQAGLATPMLDLVVPLLEMRAKVAGSLDA